METEVNIKEQILSCALSPTASGLDFAFSSASGNARKEFLESMADFLRADKYIKAERRCRDLYSLLLTQHDKYPVLGPTIDRANLEELYGAHGSTKHRLHYCHQANVFLLGLYVYHNFGSLRREIESEMERTTPLIERESPYLRFRYSGGNEYGEFLYRWRLTSLCHDIGTGISLCKGKEDQISRCLRRLRFEESVDSLDKMNKIGDHNLIHDLDESCEEINLSKYVIYHSSHPFPNSIHQDHGIMGALVFLRLMHEAYARHSKNPITYTRSGEEIFWHPLILRNSILQMATAIAMHNLDKNPKALRTCARDVRIFDIHRRPLAWLLKTADLLQEWDKPRRGTEDKDLSTTNLRLIVSESKIVVENFPANRFEEANNVLRCYTNPNDIVFLEPERSQVHG